MSPIYRNQPGEFGDRYRIRMGLPADTEPIRRLAGCSGLGAWPADAYRDRARVGGYDLRVAERAGSGEVVGYCLLRKIPPDVELLQLAVESGVRRRGIGSGLLEDGLMDAAHEGHRRCFLEVRAGSDGAIEFYRHHGFREISRRAGYYSHPREDAIVMAKQLDGRAGAAC